MLSLSYVIEGIVYQSSHPHTLLMSLGSKNDLVIKCDAVLCRFCQLSPVSGHLKQIVALREL